MNAPRYFWLIASALLAIIALILLLSHIDFSDDGDVGAPATMIGVTT
jgi:hypothetical protein